MLVVGEGVEVGEIAAFELTGPDFRFAGHAEVVHVTNEAIGLHLLGWRGSATCRVQSLIMQRIQGNASLSLPQIPGVFLG